MTNIKLNKDLARNVVQFVHYKNRKDQSVCKITIGGNTEVLTHSLDGEEEQVLCQMFNVFWSVEEYFLIRRN